MVSVLQVEQNEQPLQVDTSTGSGLWGNLCYVWDKVDLALASFFGLDKPKYQWAIDEYYSQRLEGDRTYLTDADMESRKQAEQDDRLEAQPPPDQLMYEPAERTTSS